MARGTVVLSLMLLAVAQAEVLDFTDNFNIKFQEMLGKLPPSLPLPPKFLPLTIPINVAGIADIDMRVYEATTINNYQTTVGQDCTYDTETGVISMSLSQPSLLIISDRYTMNGTAMGNIDVFGDGPASFELVDFVMTVRGNTTTNDWTDPAKPVVVFSDAELELVLASWVIQLENLMPGTVYGPLILELVTDLGPQIFTALSKFLSNSEFLLNLMNSFYPPAL